MANRDYIVYDFETTGRNPHKCMPTQVAAIAIDGRNLKVKGEFESMIRPIIDDEKAVAAGYDPIEEGALRVTGKTRDELKKAPTPKAVWPKFCKFVDSFNWKGEPFYAPIPVGYNIIGYDNIILNRMCKEMKTHWDETRQQNKLFSKVHKVDLMDNMFMWTEGDPSIRSISMDTLRERMGLSSENAHDALQDVKDTANIFIKLLKTHRAVYQNIELDKAFADGNLYVT